MFFNFFFFSGEWKFWNLHTLFMLWKIGQSFWIKMFKNKAKIAPKAPRASKTRELPGPLSGPWTASRAQNIFLNLEICFFKLNSTFLKVTGWQLWFKCFCGKWSKADLLGTLLVCFAPGSWVRHVAYQWGTVGVCDQVLIEALYGLPWHALDHSGRHRYHSLLEHLSAHMAAVRYRYGTLKESAWTHP